MTTTPDRFPGPQEEEELIVTPQDSDPEISGAIRYVSGSFRAKDGDGVFDLRSGSGLSESGHRILRQLVHFVDNGPSEGFDSGAYRETTGTIFPTAIVWYDKSGEGKKKIIEKLITWTGVNPTQIVWKIYDSSAVLLATLTDTVTYSGVFETSRSRAIVVA